MRHFFLPGSSRAACLLLLVGASACNKQSEPEPADVQPPAATAPPMSTAPAAGSNMLQVTSVDLGRSISADKRVTAAATQFGTRDTIYASVATQGTTSGANIGARWTYQDGQIVEESTQTVAPSGAGVTEFHISKPSAWPTGRYTVTVMVNGAPADSASFQVQ